MGDNDAVTMTTTNKDADTKAKNDLDMLGVSVHWLKTGFTKEVANAGFDSSATVYDIEPDVIRGKGKHTICPMDGRLGSSYVHSLLAADEQNTVGPANFMLSYGWGYKVTDIIDTLDDYCSSNNLDPHTTFVWICCLAVNQHRVVENNKAGRVVPFEEFRQTFYSRVTGIKTVLAMMAPWHNPFYLTRIWCIFELYSAHQTDDCALAIVMPPKEKEAFEKELWGGKVFEKDLLDKKGGKGVEALYEALASTKVQNAQASVESDRLAILQLIEDSGLAYDTLNNSVNALLRAWVVQIITSLARKKAGDDSLAFQNISQLHNLRNFDEALAYKKALATSLAFQNIGQLLYNLGELDEALANSTKALSIHEALSGKNHPVLASFYNDIGCIQLAQGNYDEALLAFRKILAIKEGKLGKDDPATADIYNNIGNVLVRQGHYSEALLEFRKALVIREVALGENHLDTAASHSSIGIVLLGQGQYEEALLENRKALAIFETVRGENHPDLATSYNNVGLVLSKQGHYDEALLEHRKALAIREAMLGENHLDTAASYHNIGIVLAEQGNKAEALVEYRKALLVRVAVLGENNPDTASSHHSIGEVLSNLENYDGALVEHRKALAIRKAVMGENHLDTANSYIHIGVVLSMQGKKDEALVECMKGMNIRMGMM